MKKEVKGKIFRIVQEPVLIVTDEGEYFEGKILKEENRSKKSKK